MGAEQKSKQQLFAEERQQYILDKLKDESKVYVQELGELFEVTQATIRTDLRELEAKGKLVRTHGGAIPKDRVGDESQPTDKLVSNIREKKKIALAALDFVQDGDTIAIDTGTTAYEFAKALHIRNRLTIVTNDIHIAALLEDTTDFDIIMVGGALRRGFHCTMGSKAIESLQSFNVDKAFLSSNAFNSKRGFMTPIMTHAEIKKCMREIALQVIMMMDSAKIGNISLYTHAKLSDIDVFITDKGIGKKAADAIRSSSEKLELVIAD